MWQEVNRQPDFQAKHEVEQLEQRRDGSVLVGMRATEGTLFVRLTPVGGFDTNFGVDGVAAFSTYGTYLDGRFVQQPDGGILIVSQVSLIGEFALRLVRLTATGALDSAYAPNGERILGNLPPGFSLEDAKSVKRRITVVADPDGGFVALARAFDSSGTYLLLRVRPSGILNSSFGSDGLVSGYDLGYPFDQPTRMVRTVDDGLLLLGDVPESTGTQSRIDRVALWRVTPAGFLDLSFGAAGHVAVGSPDAASVSGTFNLVALGDRRVAVVDSTSFSASAGVRVLRFDQAGSADARFGVAGSASIKLANYAKFIALGVMPDDIGGLLIPGLAASTYTCYQTEPPSCISEHSDVAVARLDAAGRPQANYGVADGVAIWRTPAFSIESIDAMLVDSLGRIVTVGLETSPVLSHVVTRLQPGGAIDASFAANGRLSLGQYMGCQAAHAIRAVAAPAESVIVAQGIANGSRCEYQGTVVFRFDAAGRVDTGFKPSLTVPFTYSSEIALGVAADGGLLFGTGTGTASTSNPAADQLFVVLQKTQPDGTPDLQFGANGKVTFPLEITEYPGQTDLKVLADGSIVLAVITRKRLRVFKVDAHGIPVASFGTQGQFAYVPVPHYIAAQGGEFSLLVLADGSLLVTINVADFGPPLPPESLLAMRISSNGVLLDASTIVPGTGFMHWRLVALPDASVVIARTRNDNSTGTAALFRLLPDNTLDGNFGVAGAYELSGMLSVGAIALDANGRLLVAGQDAAGALLARYDLNGALASTPVVEYYNTGLRHYSITASPGEMASIEAGGAGPGWQRTGYGFRAYLPQTSIAIGALPVCRFYGTPGRGPNSHFYAIPAECAIVQQDPGWTLEGIALYLFAPVNGQCAMGRQAVYRVYNNRFAQNDSNHRYTADSAVYAQMQTQGWLPEGVVFCPPTQ